jgi:hypothetical protein
MDKTDNNTKCNNLIFKIRGRDKLTVFKQIKNFELNLALNEIVIEGLNMHRFEKNGQFLGMSTMQWNQAKFPSTYFQMPDDEYFDEETYLAGGQQFDLT